MKRNNKTFPSKRYANKLPMSIFLTNRLNGLIRRNTGRTMLLGFVKIAMVIVGRRTSSIVRINLFWLRYCDRLVRGNGVRFLVKYLKACHVLTMQAASGMRIPASQKLGVAVSRTKTGLPRIIPSLMRRKIRQGHGTTIKLVLTFLSVYRILEFPGQLNTSTITQAGRDWSGYLPQIQKAISVFWDRRPGKSWSESKLTFKPFPIAKSGSSSDLTGETQVSTSLYSIIRAAESWARGPLHLIEEGAGSTGNDLLLEYIFMFSEESLYSKTVTAYLGRLGTKQEAAGKVRVFAMVDPFTNWLLRPLHKMIFSHIAKIDQDGTFDQLKPVHNLIQAGNRKFWCYDLSAATDRLPVRLQSKLLSPYLGEARANAWANLLVERDYFCRPLKKSLKYAVGQPMGALSSGAMLALTHHLIVQGAAMRVHASKHGLGSQGPLSKVFSFTWFSDYAVLGDDIVIANGAVAREYVRIMNGLGVEIGFAKSLVSRKGGLEFAKRFFLAGQDCSPVAFKELFAARGSLSSMIAFVRKGSLRPAVALDLFGQGYRVKATLSKRYHAQPRRISNFLHMLHAPIPGESSLSAGIERFSLGQVSKADNWPAALWEYAAFQQNRLGDSLEKKQKQGNAFCDLFGVTDVDRFETGGLDLDPYKAQFSISSPLDSPQIGKPVSDRLRTEIALVVYFDELQSQFGKLKQVEAELTDIYHGAMNLRFEASEVFFILEDLHVRFTELEDQLASIRVFALDGEYRIQDDDKVLVRNPLLMAKLWRRLDAKLRSPLTPEMAARILDLEKWERNC